MILPNRFPIFYMAICQWRHDLYYDPFIAALQGYLSTLPKAGCQMEHKRNTSL